MTESFDFPDAQVFWSGAEGPPGKRVFFLAGGSNGQMVYLRCEKQQVAALGEYLRALLEDLAPDIEPDEDHGDITALPFEWAVGSIGVAYDEASKRIVVVLEENTEGSDPATARFTFGLPQAAAFAQHALELVSRGRPNCGFCGGPMDPEGHTCPRMN